MSQMMQMFFIRRRRQFISVENDFWIERHQTQPRHSLFIFGHHTNGFIFVAVNLESLFGRQIKKREHMATRNRRDECLFGINVRWIRVRDGHNRGRRRCWNSDTAVKRPSVFSRILALEKIRTGSQPFDRCFVFGHKFFAHDYIITCGSCQTWLLCASKSSAAIGPQVPAA